MNLQVRGLQQRVQVFVILMQLSQKAEIKSRNRYRWPYTNTHCSHLKKSDQCKTVSRCVFLWTIRRSPNTTNSMEMSPSWKAASSAVSRTLPSILWNPKVHYRVQKSPPLVPILSLTSPVHTTSSCLSKIHYNIIHPPTSWASQWSLSFSLSHQYPICIPLLLIRTTCQAHLILLDLIILVIFGEEVQAMKLLIMHISPTSCHLIPLRSIYSLEHPVLGHS
jgi:hypothetical protein